MEKIISNNYATPEPVDDVFHKSKLGSGNTSALKLKVFNDGSVLVNPGPGESAFVCLTLFTTVF